MKYLFTYQISRGFQKNNLPLRPTIRCPHKSVITKMHAEEKSFSFMVKTESIL